jgi:aminoglycoside 2'-N-acetyltransferase I
MAVAIGRKAGPDYATAVIVVEEGMDLRTSVPPEAIEVRLVNSYTAEDRLDLAGGQKDPSQTSEYGLQWRPTEKHVLVFAGGKAVCHVGLVKHTVIVDAHPVSVVGIGGVLTRSECRGHGYGRVGMEAAESFAQREWGVQFLLLFCRPALEKWYGSAGWSRITQSVWIEQQEGSILAPLVTMVKALTQNIWPQGEVRLCSLPW